MTLIMKPRDQFERELSEWRAKMPDCASTVRGGDGGYAVPRPYAEWLRAKPSCLMRLDEEG